MPMHARVLVADDDPGMRAMLHEILEADGYDVTEVSTGDEMSRVLAERSAENFPDDAFDVIVSDQRMPNGMGLDVIADLRRAGYTTPILLLTAFIDEPLRTRADELEAMVMHKPFPIPALRAAVDVLVSLRPPATPLHLMARTR